MIQSISSHSQDLLRIPIVYPAARNLPASGSLLGRLKRRNVGDIYRSMLLGEGKRRNWALTMEFKGNKEMYLNQADKIGGKRQNRTVDTMVFSILARAKFF